MLNRTNPKNTSAWTNLKDHYEEMKSTQMKDLFASDQDRYDNFSISFEDILIDYSK